MNILIVGTDASRYGSAVSMAVLAGELIRLGHHVICVIPKKGPIEGLLQREQVPYRIMGIKKWISLPQRGLRYVLMKGYRMCVNLISEIRLVFLCRSCNIEVMHLNTSASPCGYLCSRLLHLKLVWHIREFVEEDFGYRFQNRKKAYGRIAGSDAVIAISDALYRKYQGIVPKDRLFRIYNGIDERIYYRDGEIFTGPRFVIAHIGRFHENKGQAELLEACRIYEERYGVLPFQLWLIGSGEKAYTAYLEKKAEAIQGDVVLKGFSEHIEELLPRTDIVVVNSRCEAFGRVAAEAMMAGRLVIGTGSGGIPEITGDCGLLYDFGEAAQLAESISYALTHREEAAELARRGRERALALFTARRNAEEISALYEKIKK